MRSLALAKTIAEILDSKKAGEPAVFNVSRFTIVADYFVIATSASATHRRALLDEVEKKLSARGVRLLRSENRTAAHGWTVADFGGVMLHLMSSSSRAEVGLEKLYSGAKSLSGFARAAGKLSGRRLRAKKRVQNAQKKSKKKNISKARR
ncbi:MAG: ribosome silencing factor [Endomicrobiia bacterium]|nr:ribosome silencing factor [Endomicrobiia bacterium]